jgi:hypothetical protein
LIFKISVSIRRVLICKLTKDHPPGIHRWHIHRDIICLMLCVCQRFCYKYLTEIKNGQIYFGSWFQCLVDYLHCFRTEVMQNITRRGYDGAQLLTLQKPGSSPWEAINPKTMTSVTYFFHLGLPSESFHS